MISRLITEERKKQLETFKYPDDILTYLDKMQEEHHYTDEEMEKDLGVALWKAYALNNSGSYSAFALSEKILKKVENEGFDTGVWCSDIHMPLCVLENLMNLLHILFMEQLLHQIILGAGLQLQDFITSLI